MPNADPIEILNLCLEDGLSRTLPDKPGATTGESARPGVADVDVCLFRQDWDSAALGFEGPGCRVRTSAYTVVLNVLYSNYAAVYFDGRVAYRVEPTNGLYRYLSRQHMPGIAEARKTLTVLIDSK